MGVALFPGPVPISQTQSTLGTGLDGLEPDAGNRLEDAFDVMSHHGEGRLQVRFGKPSISGVSHVVMGLGVSKDSFDDRSLFVKGFSSLIVFVGLPFVLVLAFVGHPFR